MASSYSAATHSAPAPAPAPVNHVPAIDRIQFSQLRLETSSSASSLLSASTSNAQSAPIYSVYCQINDRTDSFSLIIADTQRIGVTKGKLSELFPPRSSSSSSLLDTKKLQSVIASLRHQQNTEFLYALEFKHPHHTSSYATFTIDRIDLHNRTRNHLLKMENIRFFPLLYNTKHSNGNNATAASTSSSSVTQYVTKILDGIISTYVSLEKHLDTSFDEQESVYRQLLDCIAAVEKKVELKQICEQELYHVYQHLIHEKELYSQRLDREYQQLMGLLQREERIRDGLEIPQDEVDNENAKDGVEEEEEDGKHDHENLNDKEAGNEEQKNDKQSKPGKEKKEKAAGKGRKKKELTVLKRRTAKQIAEEKARDEAAAAAAGLVDIDFPEYQAPPVKAKPSPSRARKPFAIAKPPSETNSDTEEESEYEEVPKKRRRVTKPKAAKAKPAKGTGKQKKGHEAKDSDIEVLDSPDPDRRITRAASLIDLTRGHSIIPAEPPILQPINQPLIERHSNVDFNSTADSQSQHLPKKRLRGDSRVHTSVSGDSAPESFTFSSATSRSSNPHDPDRILNDIESFQMELNQRLNEKPKKKLAKVIE